MNAEEHESFQISVCVIFQINMPRHGIAVSGGSFISSFFLKTSILFSPVAAPTYMPPKSGQCPPTLLYLGVLNYLNVG